MKRYTVGDVMTTDVVTIRDRCGYKEIVETLADHGLSAVPVVDDDRRVIGVVSEADLLHKMEYPGGEPHARLLERKRVRVARDKADADDAAHLMTAPAVVVGPDASVGAAARLMDAEHVKRLPVVDDAGRIVGLVSRKDLLGLFLRDDEDIRREVVDDVLVRVMWIDPSRVSVSVEHGIVTLDGTVERRSSLSIIKELVARLAGVVDVVANLNYRVDDVRYPYTNASYAA
jgi:CBS-domain-containing membrane protein